MGAMATEPRGIDTNVLLETLARQWWIVVTAIIAVAALTFLVTGTLDERYRASSLLIHQPGAGGFSLIGGAIPLDERTIVARDALKVTSLEVAGKVSENLGEPEPRALLGDVTVSANEQTESIEIEAESDDAGGAAELANAFALAFVEGRRQDIFSRLESAQQGLQGQLAALSEEQVGSAYAASLEARVNELQLLLAMVESDY